jgi:hypothetical protein
VPRGFESPLHERLVDDYFHPLKRLLHGRGDKDRIPNLAFNRFTSAFLYGSYDGEVVFIEPMATKGSKKLLWSDEP